eukprot:72832-Chlamydomonas_euryale.AAC.3
MLQRHHVHRLTRVAVRRHARVQHLLDGPCAAAALSLAFPVQPVRNGHVATRAALRGGGRRVRGRHSPGRRRRHLKVAPVRCHQLAQPVAPQRPQLQQRGVCRQQRGSQLPTLRRRLQARVVAARQKHSLQCRRAQLVAAAARAAAAACALAARCLHGAVGGGVKHAFPAAASRPQRVLQERLQRQRHAGAAQLARERHCKWPGQWCSTRRPGHIQQLGGWASKLKRAGAGNRSTAAAVAAATTAASPAACRRGAANCDDSVELLDQSQARRRVAQPRRHLCDDRAIVRHI